MRLLIADDHTLFRRGLQLVLSRLYPEARIAEAGDIPAALAHSAEGTGFDVVLCDLAMPGMEDLKGLDSLRQRFPEAAIVMLSAVDDPDAILRAIERGARGYILKSASDEALKHALSLILAGETYLPSHAFLDPYRRRLGARSGQAPVFGPDNPLSSLTERQREVLTLMMAGQSNKEIARNLKLLESTVKAHVKIVLGKLSAANRTQAVMKAAELGWRRPEPAGRPRT